MTRYKVHPIDHDGWTDWFYPWGQEEGEHPHKTACCDCGLVHQIQYRIDEVEGLGDRVAIRVRRDERATAAKRRKR